MNVNIAGEVVVPGAAGVRHAGFGAPLAGATSPCVLSVDGKTPAYFSLCSALPLGANATADRAGIAPIRVRQSSGFDSTFLDETPGTPPHVHSRAHEPDGRAAEAGIREARPANDFVVGAPHRGVPFCYLPATQGPLAEYQRSPARRVIGAGADLVIGHHPHGLHPVELAASIRSRFAEASRALDASIEVGDDGYVSRTADKHHVLEEV